MPAFAARLVFGQMGDELLLASQRVEPAKLTASGYVFQKPALRAALEGLLKK
jgi:NAD dependent epimerase/dehydratase family enzyme